MHDLRGQTAPKLRQSHLRSRSCTEVILISTDVFCFFFFLKRVGICEPIVLNG